MSDPSLLVCVCVSALAGTCVGFVAGLVPGLHMNNIAALFSAYAVSSLGAFAGLSSALGSSSPGVAISSFLSAALIAHTISESVPSTYVGIPSGDVVSVLPAHRLAKAGLGHSAIRASADGVLAGVLVSTVALFPICLLMGEPVRLYEVLRRWMGAIVVFFSCVLLLSEGSSATSDGLHSRLAHVLRGAVIFAASGLLGYVVLKTWFYSSALPDLPWMPVGFVPKDSLLLPLFAGLFGIPSLILSIGSAQVADLRAASGCVYLHRPAIKDVLLSLIGGTVVGWMPGMTSGATVTLCSPTMKETTRRGDIPASLRFIWLYSAISASGAVFALGALFTILRARSGTMDSVSLFLGRDSATDWPDSLSLMLPLVMAMMISALVAHTLLGILGSRIRGVRSALGSKKAAVASIGFIVSLSVSLTGVRGAVLLMTSAMLGLLPPMIGVRRIQLMGCLLLPIAATLLM